MDLCKAFEEYERMLCKTKEAPVGTIFLVNGNGLIPCDGRKLIVADYPELFTILKWNIPYDIRSHWGTADWEYFFNVPDLVDKKGVFGWIKAK